MPTANPSPVQACNEATLCDEEGIERYEVRTHWQSLSSEYKVTGYTYPINYALRCCSRNNTESFARNLQCKLIARETLGLDMEPFID